MEETIIGRRFDEERALYNFSGTVRNCGFSGPADGESALKEARDVRVEDCVFSLRYPMWHMRTFYVQGCTLEGSARAALWYCHNGKVEESRLGGIKALRECSRVTLRGCTVDSGEFGWKCRGIQMSDSVISGEYLFLDSRDLELSHVQVSGRYAFQYVENLVIRDSVLDTKDAFWHSVNVTVVNSVVKGEYLGWYSRGLTLVNCQLSGLQPLCCCESLRLENCTMDRANLAFEYSGVQADILGGIESVKNPRSGLIVADSVGEIVRGGAVMECSGEVRLRGEKPRA